MYFPYIRGRQFELLALRELVEKDSLSSQIIPIIEPVKLTSTLITTMERFIDNDRKLCVIVNPTVGSFLDDMEPNAGINQQKFIDLMSNNKIIKSYIVNDEVQESIDNFRDRFNMNESFIINTNRDNLSTCIKLLEYYQPSMTFIPDDRQFKRKVRIQRALIADRFNKRSRNSDYADRPDEFFSDDHLYYKDENFIGFSDYSVIGSDFLESGFAPYAVAIHIVYFDEDYSLRIRHFVSDSNDDIQNPAGKFYEAVTKIQTWVNDKSINPTDSLQVFLNHYENGTYPGLGSVKKISLMHHLELIGTYLDEVSE
ncbi:sce7725 family protein [Fundicoccus culcitae]|uniref:Sce7725 family protein n=1 Tax=Fundicoccus culcitae TaxID=2969821 RepID=A0ABY5PA08_9LACT|nr:sce7725 family protein [Fundicoccus culcitae]UUX35188.1 sce7725 family protein [Fundicoccus culcitae]